MSTTGFIPTAFQPCNVEKGFYWPFDQVLLRRFQKEPRLSVLGRWSQSSGHHNGPEKSYRCGKSSQEATLAHCQKCQGAQFKGIRSLKSSYFSVFFLYNCSTRSVLLWGLWAHQITSQRNKRTFHGCSSRDFHKCRHTCTKSSTSSTSNHKNS